MQRVIATALFLGFLAFTSAQESSPGGRAGSTPIGRPVGDKAPAFAARDQFGKEQTNETLQGSNGTVILFFRSADW